MDVQPSSSLPRNEGRVSVPRPRYRRLRVPALSYRLRFLTSAALVYLAGLLTYLVAGGRSMSPNMSPASIAGLTVALVVAGVLYALDRRTSRRRKRRGDPGGDVQGA